MKQTVTAQREVPVVQYLCDRCGTVLEEKTEAEARHHEGNYAHMNIYVYKYKDGERDGKYVYRMRHICAGCEQTIGGEIHDALAGLGFEAEVKGGKTEMNEAIRKQTQ